MYKLNPEDNVELGELLEQVNYALSLKFMEKWRHKYSEKSSLVSLYTKKHKYSEEMVREFLRSVDISLYYPLIYFDRTSKP